MAATSANILAICKHFTASHTSNPTTSHTANVPGPDHASREFPSARVTSPRRVGRVPRAGTCARRSCVRITCTCGDTAEHVNVLMPSRRDVRRFSVAELRGNAAMCLFVCRLVWHGNCRPLHGFRRRYQGRTLSRGRRPARTFLFTGCE